MTTRREYKCLTVGDGDFSFSLALVRSSKCGGESLLATSYDSFDGVVRKYGEAAESNVKALVDAGAVVQHGVDATQLEETLLADVVVEEVHFMHPLIDAGDSDRLARSGVIACNSDVIIQNRLLVLRFLRSAQKLLARPIGEIKVTVKDVYPYSWWRVGRLAEFAPPLRLKRVECFVLESFPGYVSRTVDRDGILPVESASSYVFGHLDETEDDGAPAAASSSTIKDAVFFCDTCDKTFTSDGDRSRHLGNRKHNARSHLEERWSVVTSKLPP
eukprot:3453252-Rhodomonas_salina.2